MKKAGIMIMMNTLKNIQEAANEAVEQLGYYDLAAQPVYLLLTNSWNEALDWVKSTELAPVNNGIPVLDALCAKYNNEELTLHQLVHSIWNESVKD